MLYPQKQQKILPSFQKNIGNKGDEQESSHPFAGREELDPLLTAKLNLEQSLVTTREKHEDREPIQLFQIEKMNKIMENVKQRKSTPKEL